MIKKALLLQSVLLMLVAGIAEAATFTWGPYLRLRYEYWNNTFDYTDTVQDLRRFYRIKASLWGKLDINNNWSVYAKLTDESKAYLDFYSNNTAQNTEYNINEAIIDNLYVDIKKAFGAPVDLRIGRQDLLGLYGDGFLIMEGTPLDGSRTFYFNAAKASWSINEKNSLDALLIRQPRYDQLPVINEVKGRTPLAYTNETAFALFQKTDSFDKLHWENYYIWKQEDGGGAASSFNAEENKLNTVGSYVKYTLGPWSLRGQAAYQFGSYGSLDRRAYGGNAAADREFKEYSWRPTFGAGVIYLSGDDRTTSTVEAWDPLFSRWPVPSEIYLLSYASETGLGYWENLTAYRTSVSVMPFLKTKVGLWYSWFFANESVTPGALLSTGKDRGRLLQAKIDYIFNKNISTYLLVEHLTPGDFYVNGDPALFVRTELQFKY